ncbi:hypothetical protein ACWCWD_31765 [Streptomyces sp. NPDC001493]
MRKSHASECLEQMQGQMHVHAPDLPGTVVVPEYFFRAAFFMAPASLPLSVTE